MQSCFGRKFGHFYIKIQFNAIHNRTGQLLAQGSGLEGTKTLGRRLALRPPVATTSSVLVASFGLVRLCPLRGQVFLHLNLRITVVKQASLPGGVLRSDALSPSRQCPLRRCPDACALPLSDVSAILRIFRQSVEE